MADFLTQNEIVIILNIVEDEDMAMNSRIDKAINILEDIKPSGNINEVFFKVPQGTLIGLINLLKEISKDKNSDPLLYKETKEKL
jgi:hypothetical protein